MKDNNKATVSENLVHFEKVEETVAEAEVAEETEEEA